MAGVLPSVKKLIDKFETDEFFRLQIDGVTPAAIGVEPLVKNQNIVRLPD
jgi:hypothetical protein